VAGRPTVVCMKAGGRRRRDAISSSVIVDAVPLCSVTGRPPRPSSASSSPPAATPVHRWVVAVVVLAGFTFTAGHMQPRFAVGPLAGLSSWCPIDRLKETGQRPFTAHTRTHLSLVPTRTQHDFPFLRGGRRYRQPADFKPHRARKTIHTFIVVW